jgi:hypothetical protein
MKEIELLGFTLDSQQSIKVHDSLVEESESPAIIQSAHYTELRHVVSSENVHVRNTGLSS